MSDNLKENVEKMLHQVVSGDIDGAKESMSFIMAQKVNSALEQVKVDVADQYFNGAVKEEINTEFVVYHKKTGAVKSVHNNREAAKTAMTPEHKIGTRKAGSDNSFVSEEV